MTMPVAGPTAPVTTLFSFESTSFVGTFAPSVIDNKMKSTTEDFTGKAPMTEDITPIIIGAVVGACICILLVVLVLALVYRKQKRDAEINAIASQATANAIYSTAHVFGSDLSVSNQSFAPLAHSMTMGSPLAHSMTMSGSATMQFGGGGGGFACPHCTNTYPSAADVAIHVQKRHAAAGVPMQRQQEYTRSFTATSTADMSTARFDDADVAMSTVRYDSSMPMTSTVEPANYRGLAPYSTVGEERFSKFQN
jgi:hypothetical protein